MTGIWGRSVGLPCDVSHPPEDSIHLLLWFRDSLTTPIYRFDGRWQSDRSDAHWVDDVLGKRASLDVTSTPAILRLASLTLDDQGLYKCRVDFRSQPTKTTRVKLSVVVPPDGVTVVVEGTDGAQRPVRGVVGPLLEGELLQLTCIAEGGTPPPLVVWFENTQLIDSHMESENLDEQNTTIGTSERATSRALKETYSSSYRFSLTDSSEKPYNTLTLGPLSRRDLKLLLTCEASNNNLTLPTSVVVMVDMALPPLTVQIRGSELPWIAEQDYLVDCEVWGSRPPPIISWWKGDTRVMETTETSSLDGNITTSSIVVKPTASQDGSLLRCMAENRQTNTLLEDVLNLEIHYVPTAEASFGSSLDASNIKEGDDVYFECVVSANPYASHISWRHNNAVLVHNVSSGIIISSQSLVLQGVTRSQAGFYSCHAHNAIGDGASNVLRLDIKYSPFCTPGQETTYPVGRLETAEVACSVQANPQHSTFQWMFNNSADTINVPKGRFTSSDTESVITYTPMALLDYGTLLCWATNDIGRQREPCAFQIVPAERPSPLTNCTVRHRTPTTARIECVPGSGRGFKQTFHLKAREQNSKHTVSITASTPRFSVDGLLPGLSYNVMLTAENEKGLSTPQHITITTLKENSSLAQTPDGPLEAEVREESKAIPGGGGGGDNAGGGSQQIKSRESSSSSSSMESKIYSHLIPAALGLGAGLILIIFILLFLIIFRTCHIHQPRHPLPSSTAVSISDQTRSALNSPVASTKHSMACNEKELQIDSDNELDPDIIPLQDDFVPTGCGAVSTEQVQATSSSGNQIKYSPLPTIITCKKASRYSRLSPSSTTVLTTTVVDPSCSTVPALCPPHPQQGGGRALRLEDLPRFQESTPYSMTRASTQASLCSPESTPKKTPHSRRQSEAKGEGSAHPSGEYSHVDQDAPSTTTSYSKTSSVEEEEASSAPLLDKRESSV